MASCEVLTTAGTEWSEFLQRVSHDVYHTPEYHSLSGFGQEGTPMAFVYEEDGESFLWPYLLTPIDGAPGYFDATSVYGYPGPVGSPGPEFVERAWTALLERWRSQHVVSVFTRFHSLLANYNLLAAIPDASAGIREFGSTVSIDLTLPPDLHTRQYHKNLRYDIRKAREAGLVTTLDTNWTCIDAFVDVYQDTMARCGSRPEYVVDREWVTRFRETLGSHAHLFVTKLGDAVAAAMIVIEYNGFLHCHLIGSAPAFAAHSPSKVLLDDVRIWGCERGCVSMHLGGGLGGREDALFQFKRKFSPLTHSFCIGSWVLDAPMYQTLDAQNRAALAARGIVVDEISYFPSYRFNPAF